MHFISCGQNLHTVRARKRSPEQNWRICWCVYKLLFINTTFYFKCPGTTGWILAFNKDIDTWRMSHYYFKDMNVTLLDSSRRPFGKLMWEVANYTCNQGQTMEIELLLSTCHEDQFTCNDGTCIPLEYRCNNKQDCLDVSDEKQCKIIALDEEKYLKDKTPTPLQERIWR